jgi:RHS repeat-associated protein
MKRLSCVLGIISAIGITTLLIGGNLIALPDDFIFRDGFENHAPEITSLPVTAAEIDLLYTYDVIATDFDGDLLLYELLVSPENMSIGEFSGEIRWTPDQLGVFPVELLVWDGNGGSDQQQWEIEVVAFLDSDGDGLGDDEELGVYATNPLLFDTDDDGFGDGTEILAGTDPLNPDSIPGGPPDPEANAPDPDPTVVTTIIASTEFLYTGDNPVQSGVDEGTIEPEQAAVVRGRVLDSEGGLFPDATITVLNHPEYGQTVSRFNGLFDLAVNGGDYLVINYHKSGYLPAQRKVFVPIQDYAWVPDVVLIPLDPIVTLVDMGAAEVQVARGTVISDSDGTRQATLLFQPGTTADILMGDGSTQAADSLHIRATEYSVGSSGPNAMPAELPPESAYTYCVELSADEAVSKVNGKDVIFNQPVPFYVDNFLGFPAGETVPVGYYDSDRGTWIPGDSGTVIDVLASSGAMADIDVDGDGVADTGQALSDLGISDVERQKMATLYQAGDSLWRAQLNHLSTWDLNWGRIPPDDASFPDQDPPLTDDTSDQGCQVPGSIVECQNQVLGERIPVVGTPFTLNYRSSNVPGRSDYLNIFLSGESVPESLLGIELVIEVAGRRFNEFFEPLPNQSTLFFWDGLDAYGRKVMGKQPVIVRIGYVYQGQYGRTSRFGYNAGGAITGDASRDLLTLWQTIKTFWGTWEPAAAGLGSWTLDVHHSYSPIHQILYRGDGGRQGGQWQDKKKAVSLGSSSMYNKGSRFLTVAPDGRIYFYANAGGKIYRMDSEENISPVAGGGSDLYGEGIPATDAQFRSGVVEGLAISPEGELYLSETSAHRIRKIDEHGLIWTVAGTDEPGYSGDGGPAEEAQFNNPKGLAFSPDGSLYIVDSGNARVRRVDPSGTIATVAGGGSSTEDGIPATEADLSFRHDVAVGHDGSFYVAGYSQVVQIDPSGIISTVIEYQHASRSVAVGLDGSVYAANERSVLRRDPRGTITPYAGTGETGCYLGDGSLAVGVDTTPMDIAIGPEGDVYGVTDKIAGYGGCSSLFKVTSVLPGFSGTDLGIPSEDGALLYRFSAEGRHLQTLNTLTGAVVYEFGYSPEGLLNTVTDGYGNVTKIERDPDGTPTAVIGPFGQRTELTLDENGYLVTISNPAGEDWQFGYTNDGLLTTSTDPNELTSSYAYDELGRLTRTDDPAGGSQTLARTDLQNAYEVSRTSELGRSTTYRVASSANGDKVLTNTFPDGLQANVTRRDDGNQTATLPDGTDIDLILGPDPRFGMQSPVGTSLSVATPSGLDFNMSFNRAVTLADENDLLSLQMMTETTLLNGRNLVREYNALTRTFTTTTPQGRSATDTFNEYGRVIEHTLSGLESVHVSYDANGRMTSIIQGSGEAAREMGFTYDSSGFLSSITDPLLRSVEFEYDAAGRIKRQVLTGSREVLFEHDAKGNLASITPPGKSVHLFEYTAVDKLEAYGPPELATAPVTTTYIYNSDRQLTRLEKPGRTALDVAYDNAGRVSSKSLPRGMISFVYDAISGKLTEIAAPGGETVSFVYDGPLLTERIWAGTISGSIQQTLNNDFHVVLRSINNSHTIAFTYDQDGLLSQAGDLVISRDPANGSLIGTTLGSVTDSQSFNGFGEKISYSADHGGSPRFSAVYTRDKLGRIIEKTETVEADSHTYTYSYDAVGRLTVVEKDTVTVESYTYDHNGNRVMANGLAANHDNQDRLNEFGAIEYTHTDNGDLRTRTIGAKTTSYTYDVLGNLIQVVLPDGTQIDYVIDGTSHRIGKKIDGALVQGLLYKDQLNPVAELDGSGMVISRFVYGGNLNVPDYMVRGGTTYRIISDHLGSPRLVIDITSGTAVQKMDYDAFGNVIADTNPGFQPFGFAGGIYDQDTGLTHFGARDYDAEAGRWTAKDPLRFFAGDTNLYGYVLNDPVNYLDPLGLVGQSQSQGIFNEIVQWANEHGANAAIQLAESIPAGEIGAAIGRGVQGIIGQVESVAGVILDRGVGLWSNLNNRVTDPTDLGHQAFEVLGCIAGLAGDQVSSIDAPVLPSLGGQALQILSEEGIPSVRDTAYDYFNQRIPETEEPGVGQDATSDVFLRY